MFGQKNTFGTSTSFGGFNASPSTSSPFGFKPAGQTSTFGAAPAFGASATPQHNTSGGGLFGASTNTGGLFGSPANTATVTPAFGSTGTTGFGAFGQNNANTSGGLFGAGTSGGLFGQNQTSTTAFGAKPTGFGFGASSTTNASGGLFGTSANTSGGLFGQQNNMSGGGLFGNTAGFGQPQQANAGTSIAKFTPVMGTDNVVKSGTSSTITIKHHCITCMKEYEGKSLEELRLEDYTAGRRGAAGGMFQPTENKPATGLFGQTSAFGQPATSTSGGGLFGSTLGQQPSAALSFGGATNTDASSSLFGAKPAFGATSTAGTGLFGASSAPAPAFGASTSGAFGFGNTQQQSGGLFGAKPATGFGASAAAPTNTGFGGFGTNTTGGLFGAKTTTSAPAFGTQAPAFGSLATGGGFGTSTSTSGGIFGGGALGAKPAAPAFGFGATQQQPTLGGLGAPAASAFSQPKPTFPSFNTSTGFGLGAQNAAQPTLGGFGTGTGTLGGGGLGGFGTLGSSTLGGSTFGGGLGTLGAANTTLGQPGATLAGVNNSNIHEQILSLVARPYGESPLYKNLPANTSVSTEDQLRPTNPAAVKAVLEKSNYKVSPPDHERLRLRPLAPARNKKSLFDGLEESDASVEERLSLKPSRKRLVLRPQQRRADDADRTLEEWNGADKSGASPATADQRRVSFECDVRGVNTDLDVKGERQETWRSMGAHLSPKSRLSIDNQQSPRLYPDLECEAPATPERRASWLTSKPLKPGAAPASGAEDSVRELRTRTAPTGKENRDTQMTEDESKSAATDAPLLQHGVKLTRLGYYTVPSLQEMLTYMRPDGSCRVPTLTIGRVNYGSVFYDTEIDVAGMDLDKLVHFMNKEVCIYAEESEKPPVGEGLNRRATVTLERVWPRDKTEHRLITEPDKLMKMDYESKLRRVCDKHNTKFVEYRPETGSWVFKVEHFSKYGLTDSDDEDETPEIIKKQLQAAVKAQQKLGAPSGAQPGLSNIPLGLASPPIGLATSMGIQTSMGLTSPQMGQPTSMGLSNSMGLATSVGISSPSMGLPTPMELVGGPMGLVPNTAGLGGRSSIGSLSGMSGSGLVMGANASGFLHADESMDAVPTSQMVSSKGLAMDTSEENSMESTSLYPDTSSVLGVKSPTGELARLDQRSSHRVQLMKASLYSDSLLHEMRDDVSVSTGDQLVPQPGSPPPAQHDNMPDQAILPLTQELVMPPLIVKPHTVVLKYHHRVPPFKETIAGRLGAGCIADMAVCRARYSRVGFAPAGRIALVTTHHTLADLPQNAPLSSLGEYVSGRSDTDWSSFAVARFAIAGKEAANNSNTFQEALAPYITSLLEHSSGDGGLADVPPRLRVSDRLALLRAFVQHGTREDAKNDYVYTDFGVSWKYWRSVWSLCAALWECELDPAAPSGDALQLRRRQDLRNWLTSAAQPPTICDEEEPNCAQVLSLMLCGRTVEACRLARESGDLNMAAMIAQAGGDSTIRQLFMRQLDSWRESGALSLIGRSRVILALLAAARRTIELHNDTIDVCEGVDWLTAFRIHNDYLCPQVSTVEEAIRSFEASFCPEDASSELSDQTHRLDTLHEAPPGLALPVPDYHEEYECTVEKEGSSRRVLDLRYELLRARATGCRPNVEPATHTPDPLDHTLSFLVGTWLGDASVSAVVGLADQLEAAGAWHLAAATLLYHPSDAARGVLVRGVVSRGVPARADTPEARSRLELLVRLGVPERWVLVARATRAQYEGAWALAADLFAAAGEWNDAHRILLDTLVPDAVLADCPERLSGLVSRLAERPGAGWEVGGGALHRYLRVCSAIRALVSDETAEPDRAALHARLEALRPQVWEACRSLGSFATPTRRHAAARAELSSRLLHAAVLAGASHDQLTRLVAALRLPPDTTHHVLRKITAEIADRAAESCAVVANVCMTSPDASRLVAADN